MTKKSKSILEEMRERVAKEPVVDDDVIEEDLLANEEHGTITFSDNYTTVTGNTTIVGSTISAGTGGQVFTIVGARHGAGTINTTVTGVDYIDPITTVTNKVDTLSSAVDLIMEKLKIIEPDIAKHEKYPALKDLYDQYKMIEKMIGDEKDDKEED